jgi:crossover junction endodeoxyribonuclease RuvC
MTIYVGIDPGITGAIAILGNEGQFIHALRVPIIEAGNARKEYDLRQMSNIFLDVMTNTEEKISCWIEKQTTAPGDGRVGIFRFGIGYGMWQGLLTGLGVPFEFVTPQRWQGAMLAGHPRSGRDQIKVSAVAVAKNLFPPIPIKFKKDWGMADAALIAEYGRRAQAKE